MSKRKQARKPKAIRDRQFRPVVLVDDVVTDRVMAECSDMSAPETTHDTPNETIQPQEAQEGLQAGAPAQEEAAKAPVLSTASEGATSQVAVAVSDTPDNPPKAASAISDVWLVHKATSPTSIIVRRESDGEIARCRVRDSAKYRRNVPVNVVGTVATGLYEGKPPVVKRVEVAS